MNRRFWIVLAGLVLTLLLTPLKAQAADVGINATNFPDPTFRSYVQEECDLNQDGKLSEEEIAKVSSVRVEDRSITTMKGVEYFTELRVFSCTGNPELTSLNVSACTKLSTLMCQNCGLQSLDVSKNTSLKVLYCFGNQLTSLKLCSYAPLDYLICSKNQLSSLSVPSTVRDLRCAGNNIASIDIRNCETLKMIYYTGSESHAGGDVTYMKMIGSTGFQLTLDPETQVIATPYVTTQPAEKTVAPGDSVKFSVATKGADSFVWMYTADNGVTWKEVSAESGKKATYTLTAKAKHDGYRYLCRVINSYGTTYSHTVTLSVMPVFTAQPADVSVQSGETAVFTAAASGAGRYQWQYSTDNGTTWKDVSASSGKTDTLKVSAKAKHNGYLYRCAAFSKVTETPAYSQTVMLTVAGSKPVITVQPKTLSVFPGKTAKFTITATGAKTYQWWYRTSKTGSWTKVTVSAGKTAEYSFTAKSKHNGYQYKCVVSNDTGSVTSSIVTLKVRPKIYTKPTDVTVNAGEKAVFTLEALNAKTYQWYYRTSETAEWTEVSAASGKTSTYSLTAKAKHNGYQYRCKVMNDTCYVWSVVVTLTVN